MIADVPGPRALAAGRTQVWRIAVPLGAGVTLALLPPPSGLAPFAWHYLALFVATILALITEPFPPASIGVMAVTVAGAFGLVFSPLQRADPAFKFPAEALKWALSGFINSTVWLIFGAFVFAMGYEKTDWADASLSCSSERLAGERLDWAMRLRRPTWCLPRSHRRTRREARARSFRSSTGFQSCTVPAPARRRGESDRI